MSEGSADAVGGRVALVTGSSRGIGSAIAARLASCGHRVAIHCQSRLDDAEAIAEALPHARAFRADVRDAAAVKELFTAVERELGVVSVLVNNAGIHRGARIAALTPDDWSTVIETNLTGVLHCVQRAVPGMRAQGWGRIVTISSPVALRGYAGDTAYGAAKAGQLGMTRCLALELARTGITVNAVIPGYVETEMTAGLSDQSRARIIAASPIGEPVTGADVAAAVAFLTGEDAAHVTGVTLPTDGGLCV